MITLDTSGFLAVARPEDHNHAACKAVLERDPGPYFISIAVLAEIAYMLEETFPPRALQPFLEDLRDQSYMLDWDANDITRVQQLTQRYESLRLGFADAAVIACAERHAGRVLTTDRRHFSVVARGERTITLLPTEAD